MEACCTKAAQGAFTSLEHNTLKQTSPGYVNHTENSHGFKRVMSFTDTTEQSCERKGVSSSLLVEQLGRSFEWMQSTPSTLTKDKQPISSYSSLDRLTLISSIQECSSLSEGRCLHSVVIELGLAQDLLLSNLLISMYHIHGDLYHACRVFHLMDSHTIVSWNTIIMAYSTSENSEFSLQLFQQMLHEGVEPDQVTFVCLLGGYARPDVLEAGKLVHNYVIELGFSADVKIANALINMYRKCSALGDACVVFEAMRSRNVISWTSMITAHCQHGHYKECFYLFRLMEQHDVQPNDVTYVSVLGACVDESLLGEGVRIHSSVVENGYVSAVVVINALLNMYGKCGSVHDACLLFSSMHECNVDSWNSIMWVCVQHKQFGRALKLFKEMRQKNFRADEISYLAALGACTTPSVVEEGMAIHASTIESGLVDSIAIRSALITMYSKCGTIEAVCVLFHSVKHYDLVLWTAVITGYAQHGQGKKALQLFAQMQQEGWIPSSVTFICILSACSHAGLIDEGCLFFNTMVKDYKLIPDVDHFSCIIDLLGKAGRIAEAASMIFKLFAGSSLTVWRTFLAACRMHGDLTQAQWAAERLLDAEPDDMAIYTLLSNIYAANEQVVDVKK